MTATTNGSAQATAPRGNAPGRDVLASPLLRDTSKLRDRLPRSRRQRRPAIAALGVMLVIVFAAVSAALVVRGDHSVAVLALARDVPAGHTLVPSDLRVARISGSGISAVPASSSGLVVGETLTASLPAGTLLTAGMLSRTTVPAANDQVVAIALKPGAVPTGVAAGRDVDLIPLGVSGHVGPTGQVARGRVIDVGRDATSGSIVLSVEIDGTVAAQFAQLAASNALAVTLLPVTP